MWEAELGNLAEEISKQCWRYSMFFFSFFFFFYSKVGEDRDKLREELLIKKRIRLDDLGNPQLCPNLEIC